LAHGEAAALVGLAVDAAGGLGEKPAAGLVGLDAPVEDLPALGAAPGPLRERDGRAVSHAAAVVLVAGQGVEDHVDVVQHADAAEVPAQVAALRPQHRLVEVLRVELHQPHRVEGAERVLDGEAGGLVDEREDRLALLILDAQAEADVLEPVLVLVVGVGGGKDEGASADGEAEPLVGLAEDLEGAIRVQPGVPEPEAVHLLWRVLGREERMRLLDLGRRKVKRCGGQFLHGKIFEKILYFTSKK